ncbi:MAG: GDSL-type esterase/lipase family protein [Oscillospiraceae bacterium]|nr:GDSL-type esterase/lipase family protein [Oscillospiraceae bacterium]
MQNDRNGKSLTPAVIVLSLLIVGVIALIIVLVYSYFTSEPQPASVTTSTTPQTAVSEPTASPPETTQAAIVVPDMTKASSGEPATEPDTTTATTPAVTVSIDTTVEITTATVPDTFSDSFFENTLFIGDSIMTGIYLYNLIPVKNVFAEIGLAPSTALTATINGNTLIPKSSGFDRAVIMLGANGINATNSDDLVESMKVLINRLKAENPGMEIVVLTVTPIGAVSSYPHITKVMLDEYNTKLTTAARENGFILIDSGAVLKNSDGYLASEYNAGDGLHINSQAYKAILAYVQKELE